MSEEEQIIPCEEALEQCNEFAEKCSKANEQLKNTLDEESAKLTDARAKYTKLRSSLWRYKLADKWDSFWASVMVIASPATDQGTTLSHKLTLFAKTMLAWALSGFKMSDEQTSARRLEMCKACPHLIRERMQCSLCGCMMNKKVKIQDASCPLKKW